ncbi:MAG: isoamylase early set domain-containing protein [Verrucomicrobiota bacterium]
MSVRRNKDGKITFVCKPDTEAKKVYVAGDFNNWDPTARKMAKASDGTYRARMELPPGEHQYKFVVDGSWNCDSQAEETCPNSFGSLNGVLRL